MHRKLEWVHRKRPRLAWSSPRQWERRTDVEEDRRDAVELYHFSVRFGVRQVGRFRSPHRLAEFAAVSNQY